MKLKIDGGDFFYESFSIVESLDSYSSVIEFITTFPVGDQSYSLEDDSGNSVKLELFSITKTLDKYLVILYPKNFMTSLNSVYEPFYGQATVEFSISHWILIFYTKVRTNQVFWSIPSSKLIKVIQILSKFTSVPNGGGARYYINLHGQLVLCDLKHAYNITPEITLFGELVSAIYYKDWVMEHPGIVNIFNYTIRGTEVSNIIIEEDFGVGTYRCLQGDDNTGDIANRMLINEFYCKYFLTHQLEVSVSPSFVST